MIRNTMLTAVATAMLATAAPANAQPLIGAPKLFVGLEVGSSRFQISEDQGAESKLEDASRGLTYALEAGVSLPIQVSFGAVFRRYDGDVQSPGDQSTRWGMDANELGILAEWRFPLGPASLTGIATGIGAQASLLTIDDVRSPADAVASAIEGQVFAGRVYGFAGIPVKSRASLLARAGWALAEVGADQLDDGMSESQPGNAADYSGFFIAGGLRISLF